MTRKITALAAAAALSAGPAFAQAQSDPAGSSPLIAALSWVQGTLLGTVATSAAVIAIAIPYGALVARVVSDLLDSLNDRNLQALMAAGTAPPAALLSAMGPPLPM